jgi:hypothetical protein
MIYTDPFKTPSQDILKKDIIHEKNYHCLKHYFIAYRTC